MLSKMPYAWVKKDNIEKDYSWLSTRIRQKDPITEDTINAGYIQDRVKKTNKLESSLPAGSTHSARRYYAVCLGQKLINNLVHLWNLHVKVTTCQARCSYRGNSGTAVPG